MKDDIMHGVGGGRARAGVSIKLSHKGADQVSLDHLTWMLRLWLVKMTISTNHIRYMQVTLDSEHEFRCRFAERFTTFDAMQRQTAVTAYFSNKKILLITVTPYSAGSDLKTSKSDVYRRQILTSKVNPRFVRAKVNPWHKYSHKEEWAK